MDDYTQLSMLLSSIMIKAERAALAVKPEKRMELINKEAEKLASYTASFIERQRVAMNGFTKDRDALKAFPLQI